MRVFVTIFFILTAIVSTAKQSEVEEIITQLNRKFLATWKEVNYKDSVKTTLLAIEKKYGIKIYYDIKLPDTIYNPKRAYKLAPDSDYVKLYEYVKLFNIEFNKYPVEFIHKVNLKYVAIVQEITNDKGNIRAAVPDRVNEVLYLQYPQVNYYPNYYKHVIHHEFYHMIEEEINGSSFYKDPVWSMFNDTSFYYGTGGNSFYSKNVNVAEINHPLKGFINMYSTASIEEDKAEIYAILFIQEERNNVTEWAKSDLILEHKLNYMKNFLYKLSKEWGDFLFEER